jgi:hypothetical protein
MNELENQNGKGKENLSESVSYIHGNTDLKDL